jgi:hypothetical protein
LFSGLNKIGFSENDRLVRRVHEVRDVLGFEDAKVMVLAMALKHLALDVNAT